MVKRQYKQGDDFLYDITPLPIVVIIEDLDRMFTNATFQYRKSDIHYLRTKAKTREISPMLFDSVLANHKASTKIINYTRLN